MTDPETARVLRSILPKPRPVTDEPCTCTACVEERERRRRLDDWRAANDRSES